MLVIEWAPAGFTLRLADGIGWLIFQLLPGRKRLAIDNILKAGIASDPAHARRLALKSFQSFARMIAETAIGRARMNEGNWREFIESDLPQRQKDEP